MRPGPKPRHLVTLTVFLGISAVCGYLAFRGNRTSAAQINLAAAAARRHDPSLLQTDSIFGRVHIDRAYNHHDSPVFLSLMDTILIPSGYNDMLLPFRVLAGPMVMLFLCGMYILLFYQCRSSTVAAFTSIISFGILHTFGHWSWGIGSLASVTPHGLVVCLAPLVMYLYLKNVGTPAVLLSFGLCGLAANIHLVGATNLAVVLAVAYIPARRFRPTAVITALGGALVFLGGSLPYVAYCFSVKTAIPSGTADLSYDLFLAAMQYSDEVVMYPEMLRDLLRWGVHAAGLLTLSVITLWRIEKFRSRNFGNCLWVIAVAAAVSIAGQGLIQLVARYNGTVPATIDLAQASVWIMPPLYVLFSQTLTNLSRIAGKHITILRWGCAALLIGWLLPADNFQPLRHELYRAGPVFMEEEHLPARVEELRRQRDEDTELRAVATWARLNTDRRAVFLTQESVFRAIACRSLYISTADFRYLYYLRPGALEDWITRIEQQYEWLSEPIEPEIIVRDISELSKQEPYGSVREWYVIFPAHLVGDEIAALREIHRSDWGQWYRVFRIPVGKTPS